MNNMKKNRLIDIDGTVSEDIPNEDAHLFPTAKVLDGAVERINKFHQDGDLIVFFTAREEKHRAVTERWLQENGFMYHSLITGKPRSNGKSYYWLDNVPGEYETFTSWNEVQG